LFELFCFENFRHDISHTFWESRRHSQRRHNGSIMLSRAESRLLVVKLRFAFAVLFATTLLCAQTPPQSQQSPVTTLRANSRLVVVDVVVTDKDGKVVRGLPQGEFTIIEDGKPQAITGFEEHTIANTASVPLTPAPKPRPGQFSNAVAQSGELPVNILLIDGLNSAPEHQSDFRQRAIKYMSTMPPGQRMAVFVLGSKLRMLQNFTDDTDKLLKALKNFWPGVTPQPALGIQADADFLLESTFDQRVSSGLRHLMEDETEWGIATRVDITLNAFKQLARATSAYPGRKNLIWVSAAFPLTFTPGQEHHFSSSPKTYGPEIEEVSNLLAANKVAVYPIDIRGLLGGSPDASVSRSKIVRDKYSGFIEVETRNIVEPQAAMREVAQLTGGRAYLNKNDLGGAIGKAVDLGSSYYTVSYAPTNKTWDGKFRKIGVKLEQRNLTLAYRRGYYAIDEDKAPVLPSLQRNIQLAMEQFSPLSTGIVFNASAMLRDANGVVTVSYDLNGRQLRLHNSEGQPVAGQLAFAIAAWNAKGKLLAQTSNFWELPGDTESIAKIEKEGWTHQQKITVPAEAARVRVGVQDRLSGKIGTVDIPLTQPSTSAQNK
jgi:VWFA-related protein